MSGRAGAGKVTQRQIAELAGVSQAVVSLVLNGKANGVSRIPDSTRERVEQVIAETGYTANAAARRLAGVGNRIVGVFTYEPAFPTAAQDFYTPLLAGIEAEAELLGCDLLMFTSAPVRAGRRRLLHGNSRLRLADGCLLLGVRMDGDELARLVAEGFPFVAVGRRDVADVPYVGLDYVAGAAALTERVLAAGHRSIAYLHLEQAGESIVDRMRGVELGCGRVAGSRLETVQADDHEITPDLLVNLLAAGTTAVVAETAAQAARVCAAAGAAGLTIPGDLSAVVLADPPRPGPEAPDLTRLSPPRTRLGAESLRLLGRILDPHDDLPVADRRTLLDCVVVDGRTLTAPARRATQR
ncbi:LacI family DNA-binding transcriptional regulator [Pseudonocardia sp. KRD291]|uniref:LacI family DNA-binding transcriptional regulator n=1 Tax=Pseudonocardia sp. KRD291 TaxID=2792007 RepID=UPI001C49CB49|nr:LacI family DNA-binding transcriptional regulator [Pseudonocardia sp. KRD291]